MLASALPVEPEPEVVAPLPGPPGSSGADGEAGTGIRALEKVGRDLLIYLSDGTGYRVNEFIPLDGVDGVDGREGVDGKDGVDGVDGKDGTDGADGKDGKDGVGIAQTFIRNSELYIQLSSGITTNVGRVVPRAPIGPRGKPGKDGPKGYRGRDGASVKDLEVNEDGVLVATLSDGTTIEAGEVPKGKDGVGITEVAFADSQLTVNMSNGHQQAFDFKANAPQQTYEIDEESGRIRFKVTKTRWTQWYNLFNGGAGGGLTTVSTDSTLTGDGTEGNPLSVVGGSGDTSGLPWYHVPADESVTVPVDRHHLVKGQQVVDGEFIVLGESVIF
jgi:hypothetical protein